MGSWWIESIVCDQRRRMKVSLQFESAAAASLAGEWILLLQFYEVIYRVSQDKSGRKEISIIIKAQFMQVPTDLANIQKVQQDPMNGGERLIDCWERTHKVRQARMRNKKRLR
jgi:hypothetical protein